MRIVFVARRNFVNHCFANWLAERHDLCAYFRADIFRYTQEFRWKWVKRRKKRNGWFRTIDELLFQFYYHAFQKDDNLSNMRRVFADRFGTKAFEPPPNVPYYEFPDLNGPDAEQKLRELKPDLAFAVCISQYLREPYMTIPRLGTVLYHEGLTPEYKGLYTGFWANVNGEPDRIGYTLMKLNEKIDEGEPLAQGVGKIEPELAHLFGYAGHKALLDGLPEVEKVLTAMENHQPVRVNRTIGKAGTYSYPGLSDEMRRILRRSPGKL